jgi:ComF family protein
MLAGRGMFAAADRAVNEKGRFLSTIGDSLIRAPLRLLSRAVSAALMPPTCCLCGAAGQAPDLDLCEVCATFLPVNSGPDSAHPAGAGTLVRVMVPFHYAYPIDHLIRALKFRGERVYARAMGLLLARAHQALRQEPPDLIVPIPLHSERYRERGFNQAQEIARFAAGRLDLPLDARCLTRRVATREQSGLTVAERRRNVRGAFAAVRPLHVRRVALVDDVLTTGSTALAAAQALADAGAQEVELWAVARVVLD